MRKQLRTLIMNMLAVLTDEQVEYIMTGEASIESKEDNISVEDVPQPEEVEEDPFVKQVEEQAKAGVHPLNAIGKLIGSDDDTPQVQAEKAVLIKFLGSKGLSDLDPDLSLDTLKGLAKAIIPKAPVKKVETKPQVQSFKNKPNVTKEAIMQAVGQVVGPNPSEREKEFLDSWDGVYTPKQILDSLNQSIKAGAYSLRHTNGTLKKYDVADDTGTVTGKKIGNFRLE